MAQQRIIFSFAFWLTCISQLSINLYPNDLATAAQTLAKQHETILNTLSNDELRNQQSLLPYLQDLERSNAAILNAINATNPQLLSTIIAILATDITTVAVGLDPLINDLLILHNITNPHPIAQQLFKAIIVMEVANLVHDTPAPSIEQCQHTSWAIRGALETCATILKADLPLLSPNIEKDSTKRRIITWVWYLTLAAAAIGTGWLVYKHIIRPLREAHASLTQLNNQVRQLNEQVTLAQGVVQTVRQHMQQTETDVADIRQQQTVYQQTATIAPAATVSQAATVTTAHATPTQLPTQPVVTTTETGAAPQANVDNRPSQQEINVNLANEIIALDGRVNELDQLVAREIATLTTLTIKPERGQAPTPIPGSYNQLLSAVNRVVTSNPGGSTTTTGIRPRPNIRPRTTTAESDRALLQRQLEELPMPPMQ
jgi:hypothetical protein